MPKGIHRVSQLQLRYLAPSEEPGEGVCLKVFVGEDMGVSALLGQACFLPRLSPQSHLPGPNPWPGRGQVGIIRRPWPGHQHPHWR